MNFVTPLGFRDVLSDEAQLRETMIRKVNECFSERGYVPIETPTLEKMNVLQAGARMPATPFRFFDSQGDLLAMRPDVTLQVARMCATRLAGQPGPFRFRYTQRIFREVDSLGTADARELTQVGIECIGCAGPEADSEVIALFAQALEACGVKDFTLVVGTVGILRALLERSAAPSDLKDAVFKAYHATNFVELSRLCSEQGMDPVFAEAVAQLPHIRGGREAIEQVRELTAPLGCTDGLDDFERVYELLCQAGLAEHIVIDFSVMSSFDYYTGIVFEAYAPHLGSSLGSGGRYDKTLAVFGDSRPAAGFAFYLEQVMAAHKAASATAPSSATASSCSSAASACASAPSSATAPACASASTPSSTCTDRPLRIAVPKGSLAPDSLAVLTVVGLDTSGLEDSGRQLVIRNPGVEFIIVRPTDAPVFVALGAADCGICGKDSLVEADLDVVELVNLGFGACRFVVAEPAGAREAVEARYCRLGSIRVATKYPHITRDYYAKIGVQAEIVKLHGNIELAPLTGMAERIVDITATGTTLRENNLVVVDDVMASTARFFANSCAFRTDARIAELAAALQRVVNQT